MSGETIRAVSVGNRRAWNRLTYLAQEAIHDELDKEPREFRREFVSRQLASRIATALADAADKEGLALTWQVKR